MNGADRRWMAQLIVDAVAKVAVRPWYERYNAALAAFISCAITLAGIWGGVYSVKGDIIDLKVEIRGLSRKIDERIPVRLEQALARTQP